MEVLAVIYCILGYIAAGSLLFRNTSVFGFGLEGYINGHMKLIFLKFLIGVLFGWILIPIWVIKGLLSK